MELLDRYLEGVRRHLPWKRQDDIIAELKANLESQLEEHEAGLGRPMTEPEAREWVRQLGPPYLMAAKYQPQQYLIGPTIFPMYRYVLRMVLIWWLVIYCIANAVQIAFKTPTVEAIGGAVLGLPGGLIIAAAWITLIFAAIEFISTHYPGRLPQIEKVYCKWMPEHLPAGPLKTAGPGKPRSFAQAAAEAVVTFFLLVWVLLIPHHPALLLGPGARYLEASPFRLAPVWWTFYWWIVVINIGHLAWRVVDLLRWNWQHRNLLQHMTISALGLIPVVYLLTSPVLVMLKNPEADADKYGTLLYQINLWGHRGFLVALAISVVTLIVEGIKYGVQEFRHRRAAML